MGLLVNGFIGSFGLVFVNCELGEQLKSRFDWNTFPLHIQRMIPMILLSVQNPVVLKAYGGVPCSRLTFKTASFNSFYKYTDKLLRNIQIIAVLLDTKVV